MNIDKARKPVRKGVMFTLVEMLIVIAIIAILASLLMPALQNALTTAKAMACLNGQKQIGAALALYGTDYGGWIPGSQVYANKPGGTMPWSVLLTDIYRYGNPRAGVYLSDPSVLFCPAGYVPPTGYSWQGVCTTWNTYGMVVASTSGSWNGVTWQSWTKVRDLGGWQYERWMSPQRCTRPSRLPLVTDTVRNDPAQSVGVRRQYSEWQPTWVYNYQRMQTRHFVSANILFADGHAQAINELDLKPEYNITRYATASFLDVDM